MKILNVRLGFANNSSSSHSIVFLDANSVGDDMVEPGEYGWSNFTLASEDAKRGYLHAILFENLKGHLDGKTAMIVANELAGTDHGHDDYVYIDHQSQWVLPYSWDARGVDLEFFEELKDHILSDKVVILGGNDNSDDHPLAGTAKPSPANEMWTECSSKNMVARKDRDYWTIFNRTSGAKLRLSFNQSTEAFKAEAPELVDLKITDFCPFNCDYCYQGSTLKGKHAERSDIFNVLRMLAEWQVFEVAIGGGEPTLHPEFYEILAEARRLNIVPNFTTKNLGWLKGPMGGKIMSEIGSFAYSVESADDVIALAEALEPFMTYEFKGKATVQYVVGIHDSPQQMIDILDTCNKYHIACTLLGYKNTHRGTTFGEKPTTLLVDTLRKLGKEGRLPRLAIDTVLADKYFDQLTAAGVPHSMITRKDGAFSAYIDAVESKIAAHSYDTSGTKFQLRAYRQDDMDKVLTIFQGF